MASKKWTKPRRGRGILLYALIPIALLLLAAGVWILVAPVISPGTTSSPDATSSPVTSERPRFPAWLRAMGPQVERAYVQAVAHQDELQYIPCYCGCGNLGHTAVVDCYIDSVAADGSFTYDQHAST